MKFVLLFGHAPLRPRKLIKTEFQAMISMQDSSFLINIITINSQMIFCNFFENVK